MALLACVASCQTFTPPQERALQGPLRTGTFQIPTQGKKISKALRFYRVGAPQDFHRFIHSPQDDWAAAVRTDDQGICVVHKVLDRWRNLVSLHNHQEHVDVEKWSSTPLYKRGCDYLFQTLPLAGQTKPMLIQQVLFLQSDPSAVLLAVVGEQGWVGIMRIPQTPLLGYGMVWVQLHKLPIIEAAADPTTHTLATVDQGGYFRWWMTENWVSLLQQHSVKNRTKIDEGIFLPPVTSFSEKVIPSHQIATPKHLRLASFSTSLKQAALLAEDNSIHTLQIDDQWSAHIQSNYQPLTSPNHLLAMNTTGSRFATVDQENYLFEWSVGKPGFLQRTKFIKPIVTLWYGRGDLCYVEKGVTEYRDPVPIYPPGTLSLERPIHDHLYLQHAVISFPYDRKYGEQAGWVDVKSVPGNEVIDRRMVSILHPGENQPVLQRWGFCASPNSSQSEHFADESQAGLFPAQFLYRHREPIPHYWFLNRILTVIPPKYVTPTWTVKKRVWDINDPTATTIQAGKSVLFSKGENGIKRLDVASNHIQSLSLQKGEHFLLTGSFFFITFFQNLILIRDIGDGKVLRSIDYTKVKSEADRTVHLPTAHRTYFIESAALSSSERTLALVRRTYSRREESATSSIEDHNPLSNYATSGKETATLLLIHLPSAQIEVPFEVPPSSLAQLISSPKKNWFVLTYSTKPNEYETMFFQTDEKGNLKAHFDVEDSSPKPRIAFDEEGEIALVNNQFLYNLANQKREELSSPLLAALHRWEQKYETKPELRRVPGSNTDWIVFVPQKEFLFFYHEDTGKESEPFVFPEKRFHLEYAFSKTGKVAIAQRIAPNSSWEESRNFPLSTNSAFERSLERQNSEIQVWDTKSNRWILSAQAVSGRVLDMRFIDQGQRLLVASVIDQESGDPTNTKPLVTIFPLHYLTATPQRISVSGSSRKRNSRLRPRISTPSENRRTSPNPKVRFPDQHASSMGPSF